MDYQSTLTASVACKPDEANRGEAVLLADQAVFTSIRTPTDEGYRIIAASAGVSPEEHREITRCSPSHGALCSKATDACGLLTYALPTGRICVSRCRHAGLEHTARGGQRVHTHAVLLSAGDYRRFGCNPITVRDALVEAIGDAPMCRAAPSLPQLAMKTPVRPSDEIADRIAQAPSPIDPRAVHAAPSFGTCHDAEWLAHLIASVLLGQRVIVAEVHQPATLLDWLTRCLPASRREGLAASCGICFALSRPVRVALIDDDDGETQRTIRGHDIRRFDARTRPPAIASPSGRWIDHVRSTWQDGRTDELARLADALPADPDDQTVARMIAEQEQVRSAEQAICNTEVPSPSAAADPRVRQHEVAG